MKCHRVGAIKLVDEKLNVFSEHILRNEHIDSSEAMILLAYSIKRQHKNAILYQYTDDKEKMSPLKMPTTTFEAAKAYCETHAVSESLVRIYYETIYGNEFSTVAGSSNASKSADAIDCGKHFEEKNRRFCGDHRFSGAILSSRSITGQRISRIQTEIQQNGQVSAMNQSICAG